MRFLIDISVLRFTVVGSTEPTGGAGKWWRIRLGVADRGFDQIVRVSVPGNPCLEPGTPVAVDGLALMTWERSGGYGSALRARAIASLRDAAPAECS